MKYILLLLLIIIPTAIADTSTIDNSYFEYANIHIIHVDNIQNFSQTNGSDVPANTLSIKINNSWINLSATEDVYISNISYNVTIDSWNWSANSSIPSHLNATALMQNASTAHHLYVNNSIVSTNMSNSDKIVNVNYSLNDTGCNAQGCATQLWNWTVTPQAPNITSWGNTNTSNQSLDFTVQEGTTITFNVTVDQVLTSMNWSDNGIDHNRSALNWTHTMINQATTRIILFNGSNANGSVSKQWNITIVHNSSVPLPVLKPSFAPHTYQNYSSGQTTGDAWDTNYTDAFSVSLREAVAQTPSIIFSFNTSSVTNASTTFNLSTNVWYESITPSLHQWYLQLQFTNGTWNTLISVDENLTDNGYEYRNVTGLNLSQYRYANGSMYLRGLHSTNGNTNHYIHFNMLRVTLDTVSSYIPPTPVSLVSTQGNFWINHTWQAGTGNITDSYNVSVNGLWTNGTILNYSNNSVGAHGWSNISVWAFNSSGNGSLSLAAASNNTQVANNEPVLAPIGAKSIEEDTLLSFTVSATDADNDAIFYAQNGSGSINSSSGAYSWTPPTPGTYYVNFTANDSYGGLDYEVVTITVTAYTPPNLRLSGTVTPAGSTIAATGQGQLTGGAYDFGQVFTAGSTIWVNVSKTGYFSNNSQVTFASSDIVYNVDLVAIPVNGTPNVTSWGNNYTNNASLSFGAEKGWIAFNITANQTLTGCTWTGTTQINCTAAASNFTTAGSNTVTYQGTNANGSTQLITWTITVNGTTGLTLSGYVFNSLSAPIHNARVDFNGNTDFTDDNGSYSFTNINEGTYTVLARQVGYKNNSVSYFINDSTPLNFTMKEKGSVQTAPGFDMAGVLLVSLFMLLRRRK